jgi:hypothetical protein
MQETTAKATKVNTKTKGKVSVTHLPRTNTLGKINLSTPAYRTHTSAATKVSVRKPHPAPQPPNTPTTQPQSHGKQATRGSEVPTGTNKKGIAKSILRTTARITKEQDADNMLLGKSPTPTRVAFDLPPKPNNRLGQPSPPECSNPFLNKKETKTNWFPRDT